MDMEAGDKEGGLANYDPNNPQTSVVMENGLFETKPTFPTNNYRGRRFSVAVERPATTAFAKRNSIVCVDKRNSAPIIDKPISVPTDKPLRRRHSMMVMSARPLLSDKLTPREDFDEGEPKKEGAEEDFEIKPLMMSDNKTGRLNMNPTSFTARLYKNMPGVVENDTFKKIKRDSFKEFVHLDKELRKIKSDMYRETHKLNIQSSQLLQRQERLRKQSALTRKNLDEYLRQIDRTSSPQKQTPTPSQKLGSVPKLPELVKKDENDNEITPASTPRTTGKRSSRGLSVHELPIPDYMLKEMSKAQLETIKNLAQTFDEKRIQAYLKRWMSHRFSV